jgi:pSer/pThr/pTyr-binding forkhead associated (FHA) protein/S1-C subfamily serine protease
MPYMLRSGLIGYVSVCLGAVGAMLAAMAAGSGASAFDVKKVEASVYKVFATPKGSTGTGFLVSGRRTVITNFHVIEKNTEFMVIYRDGKDVQVAAARVIAYKPSLDLAVLRVDRDLPGTPLTLADFEPEKLTNVVTIGFPAAADDAVKGRPLTVPELIQRLKDPTALDPTVTTGVVSRMTSAESPQLNARTVQHNAAINPGNSGGPLFDKCSNVMGVNTLVALNSQGLFFSIHAGEVVRILREYGIEYASVRTPCLIADSGGGGMMIPLVLGMSAALALAALVFALRSGASLGGLSKVVSRLTTPRGRPSPKGFTRDAAQASQFKHWGRTSAMSLLSTGGGKSYSLGGGRALTVGRGQQCQIAIDDDTVSSAHARLQLDAQGQRVAITDLNSSNGTFLNGKRITSGHAQIGDAVRFGTAEFKLAAGGASGVVAPTPRSAPNRGWMLSGFDPSGRALQFELRPMVENGSASEATTTWTFGRDKTRSQFVIDDGSVSGAHAEITYEPQLGLTLRDLGSTNGTRLDGEMLGKVSVPLDETGQEITFGAAKLRLSRLV